MHPVFEIRISYSPGHVRSGITTQNTDFYRVATMVCTLNFRSSTIDGAIHKDALEGSAIDFN